MAKEILCAYGVDVDAVAGWLGSYAGEDSPDDISRGMFAGEVGSPRLLKLFERYDMTTTWFIPGHSIETFPEQMKLVADAGHEIGVHGWDHHCLLRKSPWRTHHELLKTRSLVESLTGVRPRWFRPAYGVFSAASVVSARSLDLTPVLWSTWGFDWTATCTPESVHRKVMRRLGSGGTILLHDSDVTTGNGAWRATAVALPSILDDCRRRGLRIGRLADLTFAPPPVRNDPPSGTERSAWRPGLNRASRAGW
jgi:peptidoglycan/xylan/chitin deacetylase (PgdA/CDA1 family)